MRSRRRRDAGFKNSVYLYPPHQSAFADSFPSEGKPFLGKRFLGKPFFSVIRSFAPNKEWPEGPDEAERLFARQGLCGEKFFYFY